MLISTMDVSSSLDVMDNFNERPRTIPLQEFKATFSTVIAKLELKYGNNYILAFDFK